MVFRGKFAAPFHIVFYKVPGEADRIFSRLFSKSAGPMVMTVVRNCGQDSSSWKSLGNISDIGMECFKDRFTIAKVHTSCSRFLPIGNGASSTTA